MADIISHIYQEAIRKAALESLVEAEAAYSLGSSLYAIRALEKNSFPTIYRSFIETHLKDIAPSCEFEEGYYNCYILHFPDVDLRVCSQNDLYRSIKNDTYDAYPLFADRGIGIYPDKEKGRPKGFLVFSLYDHQLVNLSIVSRTGAFSELQLFKKDRNDVILDSLSVMRDKAEKNTEFVLKRAEKSSNGDNQ